jgi:hypothetical protein
MACFKDLKGNRGFGMIYCPVPEGRLKSDLSRNRFNRPAGTRVIFLMIPGTSCLWSLDIWRRWRRDLQPVEAPIESSKCDSKDPHH